MNRFVALFATTVLLLSLAAADASAQTWQMLASFPGRPAHSGEIEVLSMSLRTTSRMDFDGDGVADKAFFGEDGGVAELKIINGDDPNQQWQIPLPRGIIAILIGFLDFDGNNPKEILLAQKMGRQFVNPKVLYDIDVDKGTYEVGVPDGSTVLLGGWDINNDGVGELVVGSPGKNEVQVWGFK